MAKPYDLLDFAKPSTEIPYGSCTSATMRDSVSITDDTCDCGSFLVCYKSSDFLTPLYVELPVNSDYLIRGWIPRSI